MSKSEAAPKIRVNPDEIAPATQLIRGRTYNVTDHTDDSITQGRFLGMINVPGREFHVWMPCFIAVEIEVPFITVGQDTVEMIDPPSGILFGEDSLYVSADADDFAGDDFEGEHTVTGFPFVQKPSGS